MTFEEWKEANKDKIMFHESHRWAWDAAKPKWKPIETAIKDHRPILTFDPTEDEEDRIWINYWYNGEWFESKNPTHWMPLPSPPEEDK